MSSASRGHSTNLKQSILLWCLWDCLTGRPVCPVVSCSDHRHLSNIDCLMACTACLVCFISTVNGCSKKRENALEDVALVAGTQQNLSNLYSLDIYGSWILAVKAQACLLHWQLSNKDCLKACTACLVCFISTVNGHCKNRKKKPWKTFFWTLDIYGLFTQPVCLVSLPILVILFC
jgi:hypothetical protein